MGHLVDAVERAYRVLGFEEATGRDVVFEQLVLARMIEPTSKLDSARMLTEAGVQSWSYRTLKRRLPTYGTQSSADAPGSSPSRKQLGRCVQRHLSHALSGRCAAPSPNLGK